MTPRGFILALKSPFSGPPDDWASHDLLREARRRLGILARLLIALAIVNLVLGHTLFPRLQVAWPVVADVIVASVTCVSLGVFLYTNQPIPALASRPAPWPASIARAPRRGRA